VSLTVLPSKPPSRHATPLLTHSYTSALKGPPAKGTKATDVVAGVGGEGDVISVGMAIGRAHPVYERKKKVKEREDVEVRGEERAAVRSEATSKILLVLELCSIRPSFACSFY